jgi:hypothetical protein
LDLQIPSIKIERYDNRERERGSKGIGKEKFVCGRDREREIIVTDGNSLN